jgi:hypothetical protein
MIDQLDDPPIFANPQVGDQGCQMVNFGPKIPIWVYFEVAWNGKRWYILHITSWYNVSPLGTMYGRLV